MVCESRLPLVIQPDLKSLYQIVSDYLIRASATTESGRVCRAMSGNRWIPYPVKRNFGNSRQEVALQYNLNPDNVDQLKKNMAMESVPNAATFDEFKTFVNEKTFRPPCKVDGDGGEPNQRIYKKFHESASLDTIYNTFQYVCDKTNSGVFVSLRKGKISKYIPFYKTPQYNNWHHLAKLDTTKYNSVMQLLSQQQEMCNQFNGTFYRPKSEGVYESAKNWQSNNNGMIQFDRGTKIFTSKRRINTDMVMNLLETVCFESAIPDVDFFINLHDYPILTRNESEPYFHMFGRDTPLLTHNYPKYLPIFSMCGSPLYADLIIPNVDDWVYAQQRHGILLPWRTCNKYLISNNHFPLLESWNLKENVAVFRGTDTGAGYDIYTNQRLNLLSYANQSALRRKLFNFGFTRLKCRIRKHESSQFLEKIRLPPGIFGISNYISLNDQGRRFKYIINVDGHTASFQLGLQMASGACVLKVQSLENWQLWYTSQLIANQHFVPIDANLGNLEAQVLLLNKNSEVAHKIANQGFNFSVNKILDRNTMVEYMRKLLHSCHVASIIK